MPSPDAIAQLSSVLRGRIVQPGESDYDTARKVYNAMIDRHPRLIVYCRDVADVMHCVNFAREQSMLLAVRGGGHNGGGLGTCDEGLVIDLSLLRGIRVDAAARTVRVEGGCTWGDVDHATHAFGMATPSGIIGTTGVGGLTLGGGLGHLTRKCGLSVDNLLEADVVLADGSLVRASAETNPDLLWALRGGGGNFGVVTSFLFKLHPVDTVVAGPTFWPLESAGEVMRWYRDFIVSAPEDLNGFFAFLTVPPVEPFPQALHGQAVCGVVWCYTGAPEDADAAFKPVREFGSPLMHGVQPMPFPALQGAFDALYPPGHQWYWRADFVNELSDAAIAEHQRFGAKMPTPQSTMHLYPIDGAAHRVKSSDTPFSYRDATWAEVIVGVSPDPQDAATISSWTKGYWDALHPYSAGGAYVNMMMDEGDERIRASYRDNYPRLAKVKRQYDPNNLFRVNQNIRPE
ncbi:FAD-binding oxidoreductase [Variovorax sp. J22G21]|uniref:FAD-binding oxidoreductase n=1 Tax=Variovorax fucosicus TaxID=3053517 RepID=UPI00257798C9|nr:MULTISPECIES: FAD-binding oxidoreductase [unclassified Variovorax]MDM0037784.1 FAD-binding oxidoreductase [Variovorax sp. J22R193]MDM0062560.1 FAD-binding oxidoreductase [Variovorax sp. J22G21]